MTRGFKSLIKRALPRDTISKLHYAVFSLPKVPAMAKAKRVFLASQVAEPAHLDPSLIESMESQYEFRHSYGYDPESTKARGMDRALQILKRKGARSAQSFLEIGCWDGMVSFALKQLGKQVTGIDLRPDGFDERAIRASVNLVQMDAEHMTFEDSTFDFVFSYGSFEHFADPGLVLKEAIRVAKPGGYIYVEFGPLYYSPYGEHAYHLIPIPYCHVLFDKPQLNAYLEAAGKDLIDFDHVNQWHLKQYCDLWKRHSSDVDIVQQSRLLNLDHVGLISKHPECFSAKSNDFDDYIVASLAVLFRKRP